MSFRFIHTADIHLGKTYRGAAREQERFEDFFRMLESIVADALAEQVDALIIAGDLFHTGQILPRTFARTIAALSPLKEAGIPCVAIEGNHDWIHRREGISWMEALSEMGYLRLLRPERTEEGGYRFPLFDEERGRGGRIDLKGRHLYGLGYIGSQAGSHVPRLCEAVTTDNNILLFHVGVWSYSPVEIGNMSPQEAEPLADTFDYVALGHGHKPYVVKTAEGRPYAWNPGSPECTNFGEQRYDKGYYLVEMGDDGDIKVQVRPTRPRPMLGLTLDLSGCPDAQSALERLRQEAAKTLAAGGDERAPLLDLKLKGSVGFHPFELSREAVREALEQIRPLLHLELRNLLSLGAADGAAQDGAGRSLADIEKEVVRELIEASGDYQSESPRLTALALGLRDLSLKEDADVEMLLDRLLGEA